MKMFHRDRDITVTEENKMFYRKDKKLTSYSFACGYIEVYQSDIEVIHPVTGYTTPLVKVNIEKDGCYHIKLYHQNEDLFGHFSYWESFDTLTEARKFCGALLKELRKISVN